MSAAFGEWRHHGACCRVLLGAKHRWINAVAALHHIRDLPVLLYHASHYPSCKALLRAQDHSGMQVPPAQGTGAEECRDAPDPTKSQKAAHWHFFGAQRGHSIVVWGICLLAGHQVTTGLPGCDGEPRRGLISPWVGRARSWVLVT